MIGHGERDYSLETSLAVCMRACGRYAPSPSGALHLGNLRTALLAWLSARSAGGRFVLRIDDLDSGRCRPEHEAGQLADLSALGLDWDGEPLRQSGRGAVYAEAIATLDAAGLLYPCWCTRAEIRAAASAPHPGDADRPYPGTCLRLSAAERRAREASGRPAALRVRAAAATISFADRFRGAQSGRVDDFVVRRGDGLHAYNLATVVDDAAQGVTEVVRGEDLLGSTTRQVWLARALGLAVPAYAHVPLVLGESGGRLAKRDGAVTLGDRRRLGEDAADVRGRLAASVGLAAFGERPSTADLLGRYRARPFMPPASGALSSLDLPWPPANGADRTAR